MLLLSKKLKGETQIIHFVGGVKRTVKKVVHIYENEMTHLITEHGDEWLINKNNVLCIEIPNEKRGG